MGLWDWVWDKLTGAPAAGARASAGPATATSTAEPAPVEGDRWWKSENAALTEILVLQRPSLSAELLALENLLVAHFDGHDVNLPPMPRVPELVLRELSTPDFSVRRIGAEISEDQVTTAAVLRLANSPLYRGIGQITAVEPALVRVGATAIRTLMLHQTMQALTREERKQSQRLAEILSLRAVASGAAMRMLAPYVGVDQDEAFMYGLLHNLGAVLTLRIINRQRPYAGRIDIDTFEYLAYQTHQEFGELLGDGWNLPDRVKALMANHHRYPDADDPLRRERLMLHVTEMMGGLLGFATEAPYDLLASRAVIDLGLADDPQFVASLPSLPDRLDDALQAYG